MNTRALFYLAMVTTVLVTFLVLITQSANSQPVPSQTFLRFNNVRGSAIEHNHLLYTLNFEQQNSLISFLNNSTLFKDHKILPIAVPYTKVVIYPFDGPEIEVTPVGYFRNELLFTTPLWNDGKVMTSTSKGELMKLLEGSYKPSKTE